MNKRRRYQAKARRRDKTYAQYAIRGDILNRLNTIMTRFCREAGAHNELRQIRQLLTVPVQVPESRVIKEGA